MAFRADLPAGKARNISLNAAVRDAMPIHPEVTVRPHSRLLLRHFLNGVTTLLLVTASLFHDQNGALADDLGDKPRGPNIVLILAEDK